MHPQKNHTHLKQVTVLAHFKNIPTVLTVLIVITVIIYRVVRLCAYKVVHYCSDSSPCSP